jgi:enterochelin esterase family protein
MRSALHIRRTVSAALIGGVLMLGRVHPSAHPWPQNRASWPIQPSGLAPCIVELKQRLEAGDDRAALAAFWQEVARHGTPLIEPAPDYPHQVVVTFLWRGDARTKGVRLLAPVIKAPRLPDVPLAQLLHTDVWYSSWRIPDSFRFSYLLASNAPAGADLFSSAVTDPLNPRTLQIAFEGNAIAPRAFSIASMPHAPDERWAMPQADTPAGRSEPFTLRSAVMHNERKVWVYTPPRYDEKNARPYGLLVLCDGFSYQTWVPTPVILDNLLHAGKIPPMVAVFVDNPPGSRISDLQYNPQFAEFLARELLPWVRQRWNVTRDPSKTVIGGYSASGAAAAFIAMRYPELFGNVLSQSGSFWSGTPDVPWEFVAHQYESSRILPIRFYLEAGLLEDESQEGPTLLEANRHLVGVLRRKGYSVTYSEVGGTHEPVHWRGVFPQALTSLTMDRRSKQTPDRGDPQ